MKNNMKNIFFKLIFGILSGIIITSCFPEDIPVKPYDRGDAIVSQVGLESDYRWQVYYSLSENREIKRSLMTDWDLAFNCTDTSNTIMLNMATFMSSIDKGAVSFESITSEEDSTWVGENPYGYENIDSTAIGKWYNSEDNKIISKNHVYLIDRGSKWNGKPIGYVKMMVIGADNQGFDIKVANLDGSKERTIRINKNPLLNYIALSLANDQILEIEPPRTDWDLLFTKYTYIFYEPGYIPYSVTGVLINPKYTIAALDTIRKFEEITSDMIESYQYSNRMDLIGYDWKIVDISTGVYTVLPEMNYIIKDTKGFYYKLHFIGYVNDEGERGSPKFEFQKL